MNRNASLQLTLSLLVLFTASIARAQAPAGPISPQPGAALQQAPPQSKLKAQVTLVDMPVTVRNAKGEMVHTLEVQNFHVTDNGVEQKIIRFDLGTEPLSVAVLVETSSRVAAMLPEIRKSGIIVSQTVMGPSGEAAILGFSDAVDKLQDFTTSADAVENTFSHLAEGTAGAKLYDAMAAGVELLSNRPQATPQQAGRRRVLVILSEATDVGSAAKLGEVLRRAQLANITIYSVGLSSFRGQLQAKPKQSGPPQMTPPGTFGRPPLPGTVQTPTTEAQRDANIDLLALAVWAVMHAKDAVIDHALEVAATATGGAHFATFKDRSIEKAIDEIGGELHSQYSISYAPTGTNDSGYHEIKVDVDRSDLKVRARPGYYVAVPES
jgi:VWFA-related protein